MYDRIIVPVEHGATPEALAPARALARDLDAAITLVYVHRLREAPADLEGLTQYRYQHVVEEWDRQDRVAEETELGWLESMARSVAEQEPDLTVGSRVLRAPIAGPLVDGEDQAALVLAPSEHLHLDGVGPAARELLRAGDLPVLVYRPGVTPLPIRRLLITLDGSDFASEVLEPALRLAGAVGARVTLLEVVTRRSGLVGLLRPGDRSPETAERALRQIRDRIPHDVGPVETRVVEMGNAAAGIVAEARREGADLICMATHGRGGLSRLLLGSVAESVVRSSPTPVLLFHPTVASTGSQLTEATTDAPPAT